MYSVRLEKNKIKFMANKHEMSLMKIEGKRNKAKFTTTK